MALPLRGIQLERSNLKPNLSVRLCDATLCYFCLPGVTGPELIADIFAASRQNALYSVIEADDGERKFVSGFFEKLNEEIGTERARLLSKAFSQKRDAPKSS
jgi:hypothetical protein